MSTRNTTCVTQGMVGETAKYLAKIVLSLFLIAVVQRAWGQENNSSLSGTVSDASGSVIPGAVVVLHSPLTGFVRNTTTDNRGYYKFAALNPGTYDISVAKKGFQGFTAKSFTLLVSQDAIQNAALKVGSVDQTVTVEATPPLVDNDSAVVGEVIESKQIVTYPLNGRDFLQLADLSAGVNPPATSASFSTSVLNRPNTTIIVSGNRESATSYLLDGIEMRDDRTGALIYQPSLDALEEFRVQRSFFQAENGFHPAIVNVITKAGTNRFHMAAWDFLRNTNFDGSPFFSIVPDPYHQNQFGLIFSGPIIKDKLQFLFDYEGTRYKIGNAANGIYADAKQLSGDFSESTNPDGHVTSIYDPATPGQRTQFTGNVIPPDRISQVAKNVIALLYPQGITAVSTGGTNYSGHPVTVESDDQYIGRLDLPRVRLLRRDTQFTFRLAWLNSNQFKPGLAPLQGLTKPIYARNIVLQATTTLTPNVVNVFRAGYQRDYSPTDNIGANSRNISAEIGLKNTTTYAPDWAAPVISMTGYTGVGASQTYNLVTTQNAYVLADNLTFIKGKHTFKGGFEIRDVRALFDTGTYAMGELAFGGSFTAQLSPAGAIVAKTGNPIADFLLGYPLSGETATGTTHAHYHYGQYGFFFQDDWKLAPNLMLQAGVRYEPSTYPYPEEQNNYIFNQQLGTELFPRLGEAPRGLLSNPHREFGPRFGLSYSPGTSGKTTIRGGVGTYFDMEQLNELQFENFGPPFYYLQAFTQPGNTLNNAYQLDTNTYPFIPPVSPAPNFTPPAGTSLFTISPLNRTPTIIQYNVNVQRQVNKNSVIEIGYFGSHGYHLSKRYNFNTCSSATDYLCIPSRRPFPTYGYVFMSSTQGYLHYDALQTRFEQRFAHGFTVLANYMLQKALDNDSGTGAATATTRAACLSCDYGPSEYSVHQRFVASAIDELPIGRGKALGTNMPRIADAVIGGWTVSGILSFQTGQPYNVGTTNNSTESEISARANCLNTNYYSAHNLHHDPNHQWLNINAFAPTVANTFGNCGRSIYTTPGVENIDAEVSKHFKVIHGGDIEFRAEAFNAFNHANFGIPASSTALAPPANFGRVASAGQARVIQLALKLKF